ncbi:MAG: class I SAM-dependent methyltransferase, partial [Actinomycetota bacterium]|nr:class I SAM-dependent methyltransferase [Actinomycetota bacterium]
YVHGAQSRARASLERLGDDPARGALLDLGCGSGDFTATLAELVGDEGHAVGVDAQPSMLDEAHRRARPNQSFVLAPVQRLDEVLGAEHDASFDVALSRAVLHWVPEADQAGVY